ncbi:MAG: hypothetical protein WD356_01215 [Pseudomonadales bacterium]
MSLRAQIYLGLSVLASVSIAVAVLAPIADFIKGMIVMPGVGAMLGILVQLARDSIEFEREKYLQLDQQIFTLGANSHMSTAAFDKHVEFCEKYMQEVHETVRLLLQEGPTEEAMKAARKLFGIKRDYAAWTPKSVALELEPFEDAVNRIGALTHLANISSKDESVQQALDESYAIFAEVLGLERLRETDPEQRKELANENVKEKVRGILGINELFEIRKFIIERSARFVRDCA